MSREAQLDWERRAARPAAAAALLSAVLQVTALAVQYGVASREGRDDEREALRSLHDHAAAFSAAVTLQAVAYFFLAVVVWYLFRATRARRSEVPELLVYLIYAFPVLVAAGTVISAIQQIDIANRFVESGPETVKRAEDLLEDRSPVGLALGTAGQLALAFSLVFVSLNAMRAGLLNRFIGILGIIVGVLVVIPLFGPPVVQIFWLGALAVLFLDRWPGGRGPAWESGEAVPWPSAAELRGAAPEEPGDAAEEPAEGEEPRPPRPGRRSRKRRRRR